MLTLHVISCGHGDTLLLQMPLGKWALIDCHLPSDDALSRFYQYTNDLGITTLDYVVLTHADSDHYRGMAAVLQRFSNEGRAVRFFCDSGANHKHVRLLQEAIGLPEADMKEYARLRTTVLRLTESTTMQRHRLDDGTATIVIDGDTSGFSLVVVSPSATTIGDADDRALLRMRGASPNINALSIVLVAQQPAGGSTLRILLPGDVEGSGLREALDRWDNHRDNTDAARTFDVVKVPHHGSKNGHDAALFTRIVNKGVSVAAVSSGSRAGSPGRTVLSDYLNTGWRVHCTAPRKLALGSPSAMQLTALGKAGATVAGLDVRVFAEHSEAIATTPGNSEITVSDLGAYA